MEHIEQSQGVDMYPPNSSSPALRWVMRVSLTLCGLMIVAVLLSQPRAAPYVQAGMDKIDSIMSSLITGKNQPEHMVELAVPIDTTDVSAVDPAPAQDAEIFQKPMVTAMPTSRIPVRRLARSRED